MNVPLLVEVACPACGGGDAMRLFAVKDWTFGCSEETFAVRKCLSCGCGYLSPRPPEDDMARYYPEAFYWSWERADGSLDWAEIIARRRPQLDAKAAWLADLTPGRLLDVGAQKGEFLWHMRSLGWEVEGVEMDSGVPNPRAMPIRYGDFLAMDLRAESYDVVTFWAVLEHVHRPAAFLEKAAALLKPGGQLIVLVTSLDSLQARWFRQDDYPRHLTIFTRGSLTQLFSRHGLQTRRMVTDQRIFGGTLNGALVYWCKRLGGYGVEEAMREWKQIREPDLFWACWHGRPSSAMRWISRLDRLLTLPLESVLDRLGYGFILTASAERSSIRD